jgi:hypothetical protein
VQCLRVITIATPSTRFGHDSESQVLLRGSFPEQKFDAVRRSLDPILEFIVCHLLNRERELGVVVEDC